MRLHSTTGGYDRTIVISQDFHANPSPDDTVDVYFDNVPPHDSYSLTYIASDGTETVVVTSAPFHTLQDNSQPPDAPAPSSAPQQ